MCPERIIYVIKKIISFLILTLIFFFNISFANAETSYLYYYWQWCPHCANVDDYMNSVDGYNRVNIEKKEVYFNKGAIKYTSEDIKRLWHEKVAWMHLKTISENWKIYLIEDNTSAMSADAKRLWYESAWVPFLIVNEDWKESVLNWDKPIIEYFTPILWEPAPNNNKYIIFAILWLIVIIVPFFIIKWWNKN